MRSPCHEPDALARPPARNGLRDPRGVVAAVRPQEVGDDVAVVPPGDVLVRPIADLRDVVAHVPEGDDRVELRQREHAGERLARDPLNAPLLGVARVSYEHVELAVAVGVGADLVVADVQVGVGGQRGLRFVVRP